MVVKLRLVFSITILFLSFCGSAQSNYWHSTNARKASVDDQMKRLEVRQGLLFSLGEEDFLNALENLSPNQKNSKTIYFPDDKGKLVGFKVKETPVMAAELSAKYPLIRSYSGSAVSNAADKIRFSVSHNGVQAMIVHGDGKNNTFMQKVGEDQYVIYNRNSFQKKDIDFICHTTAKVENGLLGSTLKPVDDQTLRKFRLAVSATGEYTQYHGGTVADALAAINATVTRINEVFEKDLGVTLELVPNNDQLIFTDAAKDPYDGNLNNQVQDVITNSIGAANYDIGHLFHMDQANGNAGFVGAVCIDNRKGSAFSSHPDPMGDFFDLDYVAHEMGHQFGANHTWSFESEGTAVQAEPGSGTTIMGYAGIAGDDNVALNGEDYFHYLSIEQIADYLKTVNCAEEIPLTNNPPVIVPTGNFTIPKSTAFVLTGNASDADAGDVITYAWEQIDNGIVSQATFGPTNPTGANFRSLRPTVDSVRYFPKLSSVITGNLTQVDPPLNSAWETVSDVEREMNFALTVRDNAVGGGQVEADLVAVSVVNSAGPFTVTSQSTAETYIAGAVQQIIWDVADTNLAPVNAQTVDILLSIDGGVSFPTALATNVPNDGEHQVVVPGTPTTRARLMIKASDNIFFAVNSTDFTITESEVVLNFSELEFDVCQPDSLATSFDYEAYLGFNEEVTFSIFSAPTNLIVSFTPPTATVDTAVDLVISNTENVPEGNHQVVVLATSASISKMVALDLNIFDSAFTDVVLTAPTDGLMDASVSTALQWEVDPAYTSYGLEIATDAAFTNIVDSITLSSSSYVPQNLQNETTYFWRVKPINTCGEGAFSAAFNFTTIEFNCSNKAAGGLPLEISAVGTPTITSKIAFFEDLALADLDVNLEIDHTFVSDLVVSLTSPSGTTVVLLSSSCGDLQNVNATFDDAANDFVCGGDPAIGGTVKPLGSLSSFNGESILGEWTLQIVDNAASDGGALNAFSLDVCIEGQFRPDDDNDGVFDDGDDLCLGTPAGTTVNSSGCPVSIFPVDNFSLTLQSESCRSSNDGMVEINTAMSLDYEITAVGVGLNRTENFTDTYTLSDLSSGTYSICITATDGTSTYQEHCFDAVITEPEALGVGSKTAPDGMSVLLTLQGAESYNIELNGKLVRTSLSEISLDFKHGINTLKVFTDLPCQGIHEEVFFNSSDPIVFPNPTANHVKVFLGVVENEVKVEIFSEEGRFVRSENHTAVTSEIEIDLTGLPSGIYYIKFGGMDVRGTSKVIKL
ncbi:MAG: reprolysin-like metallopeptidase [Aurantibacter sp.]